MSPRRRLSLALVWLALLLVGGWWISQQLQLTGDLRKFMPEARTPAQKLLIDELGEGPGSRLLLLAISGDRPEVLARQSAAMVTALAGDPAFSLAANGGVAGLESIPEALRPYRYLLSTTLDHQPLDAAYLSDQLEARLQDLGSPMAALVEPLLPADPTLEVLALADTWQPATAPQQLHGVWFDREGRRALLAVQTTAAGFDPGGQEAALAKLHAAFDAARGDSSSQLLVSGPGAFAVEVGGRTQREASFIGSLDGVIFSLLLLIAYRSWRVPLLAALPLASGGLAGMAAVALGFDGIHGITVAFGFTLIGVAQDYPIHLISHQRPGLSPWDNARALWPTLGTGVVATCIAYLTFLISGVDGLKQLAVFTIAGLGVAALTTRYLLPGLIDTTENGGKPYDAASSSAMAKVWGHFSRWPRMGVTTGALLGAAGLAVIWFVPGPFWQNDLSRLTPVPEHLLVQDGQLRAELGAPDVRYLMVIQGADAEAALQASEALQPVLVQMQSEGLLKAFDLASRYLPSAATQRARQARLPDAPTLQAALDAAVAESPFRSDVFAPFLSDVAAARAAPPLTAADLAGTPLAARVDGLLLRSDSHATALVALSGLEDPVAVASLLAPHGAQLLDLKDASESLVAEYRTRLLWALALAAVLLVATIWVALRDVRRTLRVLAPMALAIIVLLAVLRGFGVELNLFHLVALILACGLGLDYGLFFDHAGDSREGQLRALHAIIVCSLATLLVFALLATSSIPVLQAIGSTVALGVVFNFVLALLIVRQPAAESGEGATPGPIAEHGGAELLQ
ncbi:MMPL family transporter [Lysobacter sp. H23M47]|uniref:MMPL family transporter n=1 Tax=Lysobacter sp. H23M47 TaxID=2781024 RepID=UPI0018815D52|nr:MMPL family transporter [Lysobacter sp. H23M47]QOW24645.1 MMPL family transporter [Lysobacter sp. H23M47]